MSTHTLVSFTWPIKDTMMRYGGGGSIEKMKSQ